MEVSLVSTGKAGFGGLVRYQDGSLIHGLYGSVGSSTIIHVEILALFHGIKLWWEAGYQQHVICYSDSMEVIRLSGMNWWSRMPTRRSASRCASQRSQSGLLRLGKFVKSDTCKAMAVQLVLIGGVVANDCTASRAAMNWLC
ncbi:Polynucleotidyl transferase, Ribonuclease H fold [Spatholobus suberectus]|nr:Polynucleotidyl transferase, Ribonuclease H fold [Spatholobus suberectus]